MVDTTITVSTSNVPAATPFTATVVATTNVYNGVISGNLGTVIIPENDMTGVTETEIDVDMSVNAVALPTYTITVVPGTDIFTLTPPAGSTLTGSSQNFTIGPNTAGWLYGLIIGTNANANTANAVYADSGALTLSNVIPITGLPTTGETLYVRTAVKRGASEPTEYKMFQLAALNAGVASINIDSPDWILSTGASINIDSLDWEIQ